MTNPAIPVEDGEVKPPASLDDVVIELANIRHGQAELIELINGLVSRSPMAKLLMGRSGKNG